MLQFFLGIIVGCNIAVFVMALLFIAKRSEERIDKEIEDYEY